MDHQTVRQAAEMATQVMKPGIDYAAHTTVDGAKLLAKGGRAVFSKLKKGGSDAVVLVQEDPKGAVKEALKAAGAGAAGYGTTLGAQVAAGLAVPTVMAKTGTVVAGVGTMHASLSAGGLAAILQHTSMVATPVAVPVAGGVALHVVYVAYKKHSAANPASDSSESDSSESDSIELLPSKL